MRVLVTGAAGFVGLNIVEALLARGHEVTAADLNPPPTEAGRWGCRWAKLDVRDEAAVARLFEDVLPEGVVHGAAVTAGPERERRDPAGVVAVNLQGTLNALGAAARVRPRRFVHLSSASVYGENSYGAAPLDEAATPALPDALYGITKFAAERAALRARTLHGFDTVCARPSFVFGPWERETGVRDTLSAVWQATQIARDGGEAVLEREGLRDWVYARDVAGATVALLEAERLAHPVYNIGRGAAWSVADWCRRLGERFPTFRWRVGAPANVLLHAARDRAPLSVARLGEDVGWRPRFGLEEAFEDYMAWLEGRGE